MGYFKVRQTHKHNQPLQKDGTKFYENNLGQY